MNAIGKTCPTSLDRLGHNQQQQRPLLVTTKEACRLLSCGPTLLYAMLKDGRLERVRLGGRTTVTMASIDRLIETSKQG